MENNENKWIDNILGSTQGSKRAQPSSKVWARIKQEVYNEEAHFIPISQWRIAAAAAVLLIALNVFSLGQYLQNTGGELHGIATENRPNQSIISNYELYD